jgi:hypothetical protein
MEETPTEDQLVHVSKILDVSSSNVPLTGRHIMVPFTSKAFFEGKLTPEVCLNENHGTHARLQPKDEYILLSLGEEYYAQMNRTQATDVLRRRIKEMRDKTKSDSTTTSNSKAETESFINSAPNKISTESRLQFSKRFLLDHPTSNTTTEIIEQKIRRQSEDGNAQSCEETSRSTVSEPTTILRERPQGSRTHYSTNTDGTERTTPITLSLKTFEKYRSTALLPCLEIREEFDANGNEIKAEAIDIANELLTLHKTKANQSTIANSSTCLQELHQSFVSENSNNTRSSFTHDIEEEEEVEGLKQRVTDTQYQAICSRLDQLMLQEECYEHDKASNINSSISLQGKGWSSGFLTNAKKKKTRIAKANVKAKSTFTIQQLTTQSSSSYANNKKATKVVDETVQQQETRNKVVRFRENISDTRYISPTSYVSVPSEEPQQSSMKVVPPSHPNGTKEIKMGSTNNSISDRNSGSLFNSTIQQRKREDSNYPEVVPFTQGHDIFSGYVMERPLPNKYSSSTTKDILDGGRDASNNTSSNICTANNKKLSRFARQRREQAN